MRNRDLHDLGTEWNVAGMELTARYLIGAITSIGMQHHDLLDQEGLHGIKIRLAPGVPDGEIWLTSDRYVLGKLTNIGTDDVRN